MINKIKKAVVVTILNLACFTFLCAQTSILQNIETSEEEQKMRQKAQEITEEYKIAHPEKVVQPEENEKIITLTQIKFTKSTILPDSFFDALREKYLNKPVSAAEIEAMVDEINNEYLIKGYIASKAFLPKQDITQGLLFVSLIEGKLNDFYFSENKHTRESYLKRFFSWEKFEDIETNSLQDRILWFNASNDAKARIALTPGPAYGTTDIDIVLNEPALFSGSIFSDNAGQEETGLIRYGASASINSITGYRDIFTLGGLFSEGAKSFFTSYEIPEPWFNTRVGAGFDYSDTEIVNGDLNTLNVEGDFYNAYFYIKRPFLITPRMSNTLTFNVAAKNGASYVSGMTTQTTDVFLLTLSGDNVNIFGGGYWFNMLSASCGIEMLNGKENFWRFMYTGEVSKFIIGNLGFNFQGRLQVAGGEDTLPSSEQFQIGGVNTVRGYDEGLLLSEDGFSTRTELQYNFTQMLPTFTDNALFFAFFDYAGIFDTKSFIDAEFDKDIYSAGGGLRLKLFNRFEGSATVARTLKTNDLFPENETRFLFAAAVKI